MPSGLSGRGPLYVRLADTIENAVATGDLSAGDKLPPQRNLAFDLGVTIGTVGRAYALARERGLVAGEVGRGTYVLERKSQNEAIQIAEPRALAKEAASAGTRALFAPAGMLRFDSTAAPDIGQSAIVGRHLEEIVRDHPADLANYTRSLPSHWLNAGASWLAASGLDLEPACIVPTLGAHAAIMAAATAATSPGDRIVLEELTYASVARGLSLAGRRAVTVALDEHGIVPEDLERVCAQQHPKMLFIMPAPHNPTLAILPAERRVAIAEIARKHNLWIIEDLVYGSLLDDKADSFSALLPERTFRVGGMSKSVAAGIRGGWMACPRGVVARVHAAHKLLTGGLPFLLAETAARLVLSGEAMQIRNQVRDEIAIREQMARECLSGFEMTSLPHCPFVWLSVPEPWQSGTLKNAAEAENILIDDEDEFKAGRSERSFHRVRVGISVPTDREEVRAGLLRLRSLIEGGNAAYDSYS